jgi:hypothetical protein
MRQLSVLTVAALMVVSVTGSAFAGAGVATDPPDIALQVGEGLDAAFDLNDYAVGAEAADPIVSYSPGDAPSVTAQTYMIGDLEVGNTVKVSSFLISNENPFANVLAPGEPMTAASALAGCEGGGTPGALTGPAWMITAANVASSYADGLRVRSTSLLGQSDTGSLSAGGVTASIDEAGVYTLSVEEGAGGPVMVTFICALDDDMAGATVMASEKLALPDAVTVGSQAVTLDGSAATATEYFGFSTVDVGMGVVTLSVDCTPAADGVQVALAALDWVGGGPGALAYTNPSGDSMAGVMSTLSITFKSDSGMIVPIIQAAGGSATFENLMVYSAPASPDLAIGANEVGLSQLTTAFAAGDPIDGNMNAVTAADFPQSPNGAAGTIAISTENNFGESGQSIELGEGDSGLFDNIAVVADVAPGDVGLKVWVKGTGHVDLVLIQLDAAFAPLTACGVQKDIDAANWMELSASGQINQDGLAIVVVQGVAGSTMADDLKVTQNMDLPQYFDADMYGL